MPEKMLETYLSPERAGYMTIPILIVPGLGGSGPNHWQSHMERALPGVLRVQQDDWNRPDLELWLNRLVTAIESYPGSVLVAHSLGCPLVAHAVSRHPDLPIGAALLVAPADVDSKHHVPDHTRGFAPTPCRSMPFHSIVVASTNDPFIAFNRAQGLATAWGADFIDAGASGHINVDSGFGPWRAGERIVLELIAGMPGRLERQRRDYRRLSRRDMTRPHNVG